MIENNKNNHLSKEDENMLRDAMIFLQEEYNLKKGQLKIFSQELSQTKRAFQSQLQEYQKQIKLTIKKENDIEQLFSKISKKKKRRALILKSSFNSKFYLHLLEISTNKKKEKILQNYFSLIFLEDKQETRSVKELIEILKDKDEIKNLLTYSYKIYSDLRIKDENSYYILKKKFDNYILELKELDGGEYPFDEMFECLGIIFEIIEYEKEITENNYILKKLIEKKNAKFVEIKSIELKIRNYNKNIKKIQSHIKIIHNFYENFKELNDINDGKNLREFIENIEEYKKIDFDYNKMNQNYDAITSLTFGTYCTLSEDSSVKSSTLGSKNLSNLFFNKLIKSNDNKKISEFNPKDSNDNCKTINLKNEKNLSKFKTSSENANTENKYNNLTNKNKKENKNSDLKGIKNSNNKINKNNFAEIDINKNNKKNDIKKESKIISNNNNQKNENCLNNLNQNEKRKSQDDIKKNIKHSDDNKIEEEKENKDNKKFKNNFSNLNILGSKINQLKFRDPDESVEMTMPKESQDKNYNIVNTEYNINDSSVCDEMISFNYETANNMGRNTTNDYINKIGVKNNVVLTQELFKNKFFMRKNHDFGKLKIEKSIDGSSSCCVSCT